jgi:hypothetical protein
LLTGSEGVNVEPPPPLDAAAAAVSRIFFTTVEVAELLAAVAALGGINDVSGIPAPPYFVW